MTNLPKDNEWIEKEIYKRIYDCPIDKDGNQKENELLGTFIVLQQIEEDFYSEKFIGKRKEDGKIYIVEGREVSYNNGGVLYSIKEINIPKPTEVVAPVDIEDIIERIGYIKRYSDTRYFDWEEAKKELRKILTPVEPINQERLREIINKRAEAVKTPYTKETKICMEGFIEDLQSLQSENEVVQGEVEIKKKTAKREYNQELYIYGDCTCGDMVLSEFDKYCSRCGSKIKWIA